MLTKIHCQSQTLPEKICAGRERLRDERRFTGTTSVFSINPLLARRFIYPFTEYFND